MGAHQVGANEKKLDELCPVRFRHPSISYGLIVFYQNNAYGHKALVAPSEKISKAMRLFADEGKLYLIPIPAGGHWTLLVVDLRMGLPFDRQVRYYETLETPSDLSKECGELVLAALLRLGIIDEKFLDRPPYKEE